MNTSLVVNITVEDLSKMIEDAVKKALIENNRSESINATEILNTETLCARLNVSESTITRLRKRRAIPFLSVGGALRFEYNEVIKALNNKKR